MNSPIHWGRVGQAVEHYQTCGYTYVEVPWVVSEAAINLTLPPGAVATRCGDHYLAGSAEQSFLHLALEGQLEAGRYVACTPCFRDEPVIDLLHQASFMKVELFSLGSPTWTGYQSAIGLADALDFFTAQGAKPVKVTTDAGWDIEVKGIEVGSYGYRSSGNLHWAYGTGLAEPRFSIALGGSRPAV